LPAAQSLQTSLLVAGDTTENFPGAQGVHVSPILPTLDENLPTRQSVQTPESVPYFPGAQSTHSPEFGYVEVLPDGHTVHWASLFLEKDPKSQDTHRKAHFLYNFPSPQSAITHSAAPVETVFFPSSHGRQVAEDESLGRYVLISQSVQTYI